MKKITIQISKDGNIPFDDQYKSIRTAIEEYDIIFNKYKNILNNDDIELIKKLKCYSLNSFYEFTRKFFGILETNDNEASYLFEYPEGFLHPHLVNIICDLIVYLVSKKDIKITIKTNNRIFIARLGKNILNKKISENDIVIYQYKDGIVERRICFDDEGDLINWELGFFNPHIRMIEKETI